MGKKIIYLTEKERKEAKRKNAKKHRESHKLERKIYRGLYYYKEKEHYQLHKDEINMHRRERYQLKKVKIMSYIKKYYQSHKNNIKLYKKEYYQKNKEKINKHNNDRKKTDIQYKIACYLRSRINKAIKINQKSGSAVKDLGCSISELKLYLESKFQLGMTWDNWSHMGWHIDHIIPLDYFDLTAREEFLKANHYTNLQPLWAEDNLRKGNKNG